MSMIFKILLWLQFISGAILIILIISQKSSSDGLVSKLSNPFSNTEFSSAPIAKITSFFVLFFMINAMILSVLYNKITTPKTLIKKTESLKNKPNVPEK